MSSSTITPQELYEQEKVRTTALDRKVARLKAELDSEKARFGAQLDSEKARFGAHFERKEARLEAELERKKARLEADLDQEKAWFGADLDRQKAIFKARLEDVEAELESNKSTRRTLTDEVDRFSVRLGRAKQQLQAKDTTIEQLQTALDNADGPKGPGDDKKLELLEGQVKDAKKKLSEAINNNWDTILPLIEASLRYDLRTSRSKLKECRTDLANANTELTSSQAELTNSQAELASCQAELASSKAEIIELQDYNEELVSRLDPLKDSVQDQIFVLDSPSHLSESSAKELYLAFLAVLKASILPKMIYGPSNTKPTPTTQGAGLQSSGSPSAPPPRSQNPAKVPKTPAELEILRLKDRQTLHQLRS